MGGVKFRCVWFIQVKIIVDSRVVCQGIQERYLGEDFEVIAVLWRHRSERDYLSRIWQEKSVWPGMAPGG
jgi:hypothetical protein